MTPAPRTRRQVQPLVRQPPVSSGYPSECRLFEDKPVAAPRDAIDQSPSSKRTSVLFDSNIQFTSDPLYWAQRNPSEALVCRRVRIQELRLEIQLLPAARDRVDRRGIEHNFPTTRSLTRQTHILPESG